MPLSHHERIAEDRQHSRVTDLWLALQGLKSPVGFMQTGAHPDDEISALLAALAFREGFSLSYACAVRGEGGQNSIGAELIEDLGVLRTAEMEQAADVLDMNLYWLSETPEDSVFDFGFSKDGVDTMGRWKKDRVMRRMVEIVRTERPDILCPTFLDVPGQHGHHRAMTQAVHAVFDAAADPEYPSNLPVWAVSKVYLPAYSGAGGSYDDEVPPPPATLTVDVSGEEPMTGWPWERIGQMSRDFHRSQGMGRWVPADACRDRPLHLAQTRCGDETAITDGLPTIDDLGFGPALREVIAAFPDRDAVLSAATEALRQARAVEQDHRVARKIEQLSRVIRLAAGVEVIGHTAQDWLRPGAQTDLTVETRQGAAKVTVAPVLPEGWTSNDGKIGASKGAAPSDPYPPIHRPLSPNTPALSVTVEALGEASETRVPLLVPPVLLPERSVRLSADRLLLNTAAPKPMVVRVDDVHPAGGTVEIAAPGGWFAVQDGDDWRIQAPKDVADGLYTLEVRVNEDPARQIRRVEYPHIKPRARTIPAEIQVRVMTVDLPKVRVGYVGGGNDGVGHWLATMGLQADVLDGPLDAATLAAYDTLVIGIFAMKNRAGLLEAMPAVHDWVRSGGNLVTLYHRPWDNWDPDTVPPLRLEVGQPSLRWRVTDENADVTMLEPGHALMTNPNAIGADDWLGWHKERGLYFAKSWDEGYTPLLEMADPGEEPHKGSLLVADIGAGRHVHCALILHHQMERLVPGAFRLMANLVAGR